MANYHKSCLSLPLLLLRNDWTEIAHSIIKIDFINNNKYCDCMRAREEQRHAKVEPLKRNWPFEWHSNMCHLINDGKKICHDLIFRYIHVFSYLSSIILTSRASQTLFFSLRVFIYFARFHARVKDQKIIGVARDGRIFFWFHEALTVIWNPIYCVHVHAFPPRNFLVVEKSSPSLQESKQTVWSLSKKVTQRRKFRRRAAETICRYLIIL